MANEVAKSPFAEMPAKLTRSDSNGSGFSDDTNALRDSLVTALQKKKAFINDVKKKREIIQQDFNGLDTNESEKPSPPPATTTTTIKEDPVIDPGDINELLSIANNKIQSLETKLKNAERGMTNSGRKVSSDPLDIMFLSKQQQMILELVKKAKLLEEELEKAQKEVPPCPPSPKVSTIPPPPLTTPQLSTPPPAPTIGGPPPPGPPPMFGGGPPPPGPPPMFGGGPPPPAPPPMFGGGPPPPVPPPMFGGPPPPVPPPMFGGGPPPPVPPPFGIPMPPPMGGIPPPPSPLMGGPPPSPNLFASPALPPKKKVEPPSKQLKAFNWNKVGPRNVEGTVWAEIKDDDVITQLSMGELENLFAVKPKAVAEEVAKEKPEGKVEAKGAKLPTTNVVSLIDARRSTNLGIQLHKLSMTGDELKKVIFEMNTEILTPEKIETILNSQPLPEEIESIKGFLENEPNKVDKLGKVELFFYQVSSIPQLQARLDCIKAMQQTPDQIKLLEEKVNLVLDSMREVLQSEDFRKVLGIVLAIGNALNAGTGRGEAYGFQLNNLLRLKDTKTTNNAMTLLHFIALKVVDLQGESQLDLLVSMPNLPKASQVFPDELAKEVEIVRKNIKLCKNSLTAIPSLTKKLESEFNGNKKKPSRDMLHERVEQFLNEWSERFTEVEALYQKMTQDYAKFVKSFGEPPETKANDFFGMLLAFSKDLFACHKENIKRAEVEAKKKLREAEEKNRVIVKPKKPKSEKGEEAEEHHFLGGGGAGFSELTPRSKRLQERSDRKAAGVKKTRSSKTVKKTTEESISEEPAKPKPEVKVLGTTRRNTGSVSQSAAPKIVAGIPEASNSTTSSSTTTEFVKPPLPSKNSNATLNTRATARARTTARTKPPVPTNQKPPVPTHSSSTTTHANVRGVAPPPTPLIDVNSLHSALQMDDFVNLLESADDNANLVEVMSARGQKK
eukprot:c18598_g1_i2.p1 GENE.c18598_g1_i2~~c18598_g1_i2.p1  ORF type:complete len:953 (-),score=508.89 c18598_g1_i2:123-2981(-)